MKRRHGIEELIDTHTTIRTRRALNEKDTSNQASEHDRRHVVSVSSTAVGRPDVAFP